MAAASSRNRFSLSGTSWGRRSITSKKASDEMFDRREGFAASRTSEPASLRILDSLAPPFGGDR